MNTTSIFSIAPFVLSLTNAASLSNAETSGLFIDHLENVLGTSFDLKLAARSLATTRQAEQRILTEIDRLDAVLSSYRADSEFSRWLVAPLNEAVAMSDEKHGILKNWTLFRYTYRNLGSISWG